MSGFDAEAFFTLHQGLPREGPGSAEDVAWAASVARVPPTARILDAACGPGGDIAALRQAAPEGRVLAVDLHAPFAEAAAKAWAHDPAVTCVAGDMLAQDGPFDFIWCAGAVYFAGVTAALTAWRPQLSETGCIAFSEPCFFTEDTSDGARAFWGGYAVMGGASEIAAAIEAAGFEVLAQRPVGDAAWEDYFAPIDARIAALRPSADDRLAAVLDEAETEAALWRTYRAETGYLLSVVRPA